MKLSWDVYEPPSSKSNGFYFGSKVIFIGGKLVKIKIANF